MNSENLSHTKGDFTIKGCQPKTAKKVNETNFKLTFIFFYLANILFHYFELFCCMSCGYFRNLPFLPLRSMSIWPQTTKTSNICISALIKNNIYNKIMLNFAGCLLMAFLILAMLQVAGGMYKILSFQHFSFRKRRFQCFAELWVMIIRNDFNPNSFLFSSKFTNSCLRTTFLFKLFP